MKNQFIAKMGHFDLNLNFWGSNKIKFYVKNRLIAYLAINCIKETSQLLLYEPTTAEDATAYLEGFQVIHRLQTHLYSTIGTAPPPARDHNLFWKPEPLPQPTQPEPVKPAGAISQPSPQGSPVIIINAGDHATVNVGDSNIVAGSHAIAVDGNVGGDVTTGSEKNANKSHSKKVA